MKKISFLLIFPIFVIAIIYFNNSSSPEERYSPVTEINSSVQKVVVYKDSSCGCCAGYISLLEQEGYEVETIITSNMSSIKEKYKIPNNMESCHTSVFGDYVVEGHVPFEAISKLLREKPDIKGITLPGMPLGSPGMSGTKKEPFTVYALAEQGTSIYWQE